MRTAEPTSRRLRPSARLASAAMAAISASFIALISAASRLQRHQHAQQHGTVLHGHPVTWYICHSPDLTRVPLSNL